MIFNIPPICKKMVQLFSGNDIPINGYSTKFRTQHTLSEQPFIYVANTYGGDGLVNYGDHIRVNTSTCNSYGYPYPPFDANFYLSEPFDITRFSKIEFNIVATTAYRDMGILNENDGIYVVLFKTTENWIYEEGNAVLMQQVSLYQWEDDLYSDTPFPLEKIVVDVKDINEPIYIGFAACNVKSLSGLTYSAFLGAINAF